MKPNQYQDLDDEIIRLIESGVNVTYEIQSQVVKQDRFQNVFPQNRNYASSLHSKRWAIEDAVSRRMQVLRKQGRIKYEGRSWRINKGEKG